MSMRLLLALTALMASGTPNVAKLILKPSQIGPGYILVRRSDGNGVVNTVTLDLCGRTGYASEGLRTTRLQVNYLKPNSRIGLSNEVVTYQPGGAAQAMREVARHADHCPNHPIDSGAPGLPKLLFTITRIHDSKLLKGAVAVKVRVRGTVKGKKIDQISYGIYQRVGNVLSGTYSFQVGPYSPEQKILALHAAEQSARNLLHNAGIPTA